MPKRSKERNEERKYATYSDNLLFAAINVQRRIRLFFSFSSVVVFDIVMDHFESWRFCDCHRFVLFLFFFISRWLECARACEMQWSHGQKIKWKKYEIILLHEILGIWVFGRPVHFSLYPSLFLVFGFCSSEWQYILFNAFSLRFIQFGVAVASDQRKKNEFNFSECDDDQLKRSLSFDHLF